MEGMNGSATPPTLNTSGTETPRSPTLSTVDQNNPSPTASRRPAPVRTSSRNRTSWPTQEMDDGQGRRKGRQPTELNGVINDAVEQVEANEEFSGRSLPIRATNNIDVEQGSRDGRRDANDPENLPLEGHHHRSGTVVRSLSTKDRVNMPLLATNHGNPKDLEDDRTPTSRGSFWGKE